ncbi:N-6 DNA methylase [Candidatus Neomarinimicrobiota bacterium]
MIDRQKEIWQVLDALRGSKSINEMLMELVKEFRSAGDPIRADEYNSIAQKIGTRGDYFPFPVGLAQFIAGLADELPHETILDPWSRSLSLPATISKSLSPKQFDSYVPNAETKELLQALDGGENINIQVLDNIDEPVDHTQEYDLVISAPPFGLKAERKRFSIEDRSVEVHDSIELLHLLSACHSLSSKGTGYCLVFPNFFFNKRANNARRQMAELGLGISSAIHIPAGSFMPFTSIDTYLLVVRKQHQSEMFVGQYSENLKYQELLTKNLHARSEGHIPEKGRFVSLEGFNGFPVFRESERFHRLGKSTGWEVIQAVDVFTEINRPGTGSSFERLSELENSVYLPEMANTPAALSQDQLPAGLKSYFQLVVNPVRAKSEFIAGLLNAPLGLAYRDTLKRGATIPRIMKHDLIDSQLYLPSLEKQIETTKLYQRIADLRNGLGEVESRIWEGHHSATELDNAVHSLFSQDRFEDWIEGLPLPLATILRRYHTQDNPQEKLKNLLNFYEALSEFYAVINLSSVKSSNSLWIEFLDGLKISMKKQNISFERTTFGTWKGTLEYAGKRVREILSDRDGHEICYNLYATRDLDTINGLISKRVISIIQEANKIRNDLAHSGVVSGSDAQSKLERLEQYLNDLKPILSSTWAHYELILPIQCRITHEGIYKYTVQKITGTRLPFTPMDLNLRMPLADGMLHLYSFGEDRALNLIPLIRMMSTPPSEENACYFYNKKQNKNIEFQSYYYTNQPEVVASFSDTEQCLDELTSPPITF